MIAEERRLQIIQILKQSEKSLALVTDLASRLNVSGMTIRRDLEWLEAMSLVQRVHGGAILRVGEIHWDSFVDRRDEYYREKQAIGLAAAQLVQPGEKIILDAGTTTLQVARNLGEISKLTVITNALPIAEDLARLLQDGQVILPGGELRFGELCLVGPAAIQSISQYLPDKLFLSCAGFTIREGVTEPDIIEVQVKQAMIRAARQVILVADSSKWSKLTFGLIAPIRAIHTVVSDDNLPAAAIQALEKEGIRVITPGRLTNSSQASG